MPNILVSRFIFPLGDKVFAKGVKEFEMSPYWYQDFKIIGWSYCEIHFNHIDAVKLLTLKSYILFLRFKKLLISKKKINRFRIHI